MQEAGDINMDDPLDQSCTSWITVRVASVGAALVVKSWNEHTIPSEDSYPLNIAKYNVITIITHAYLSLIREGHTQLFDVTKQQSGPC